MVAFTGASSTPVPEPLRAAYQRLVENALDLMRPLGEHWAVTMTAESGATTRLAAEDRLEKAASACREALAYLSNGIRTPVVQVLAAPAD
jgi:hypothetical protein